MNFLDEYFASMESQMHEAFTATKDLAAGVLANPDEKRMVGHYSSLSGSKSCDKVHRIASAFENPAAQLTSAWFYIVNGRGGKDIVGFPHKDRLKHTCSN